MIDIVALENRIEASKVKLNILTAQRDKAEAEMNDAEDRFDELSEAVTDQRRHLKNLESAYDVATNPKKYFLQ